MRGLKSTAALLIVLVGLGTYIYFVDRNAPASGANAKDKAFTGVTADDIEEIHVKSAEGETSRVQKTNGQWKLVEPIQADGDAGELQSLSTSVASLDVNRIVEENATDLKQFGLEPPRIEVGFRLKGQKDLRRLLVGDKTPTGNDLYARTADSRRVFMISSFLEGTFNKTAFGLRDKKVLAFEKDRVTGLELTSTSGTLQFAKKNTDWTMTRPVPARADYSSVEAAIEQIASARMQGIPDTQGDVKSYGLEAPAATVTLTSGSSRATLALGRTEGDATFAKDASRPVIFTVPSTLMTDVIKDASEFRRKDLFDARSFTATRVEVKRADGTVTLEKTKGKDGNDLWRNGAGKDIDAAKAEEVLAKLTALRAETFEATANAALNAPTATVTIRFDPSRSETVVLAQSGADAFASRPDEPGAAKLQAASLDEVVKALDALK